MSEKKPNRRKKGRITLRLDDELKNKWVELCKENNMQLSDFIVNSVENKILNSERKSLMNFISQQGNYFAKIENNINQIARIVNTEKKMNDSMMDYYNQKLAELNSLKVEQNAMFNKIYSLLLK